MKVNGNGDKDISSIQGLNQALVDTAKKKKGARGLMEALVEEDGISEGGVNIGNTKDLRSIDTTSIAQDRQARIAAIKQAVASGTYNPSSVEVAQRIAEEMMLASSYTKEADDTDKL